MDDDKKKQQAEGEGSYSGARQYDAGVKKFLEEEDPAALAKKSRAAEEDPELEK